MALDYLNDVYTNPSIVGETFWVISSKQEMRYVNLHITPSLYCLIEAVQENHQTKCSRLMNHLLDFVTIGNGFFISRYVS